jgi:hypothetical protein
MTKLADFAQGVLASPTYLARYGRPKTPNDLAHHCWIALTLLPSPLTWAFTKAAKTVTVRMNVHLRMGTRNLNASLSRPVISWRPSSRKFGSFRPDKLARRLVEHQVSSALGRRFSCRGTGPSTLLPERLSWRCRRPTRPACCPGSRGEWSSRARARCRVARRWASRRWL